MSFNFWWMNNQFDVQKDPEVYKLRLHGGWLPGIVCLHPQGSQHSFDLLYWVCKLCEMVKRILTEDEIAGDDTYTDRFPKFKGSLRILCRQAHAGECSCDSSASFFGWECACIYWQEKAKSRECWIYKIQNYEDCCWREKSMAFFSPHRYLQLLIMLLESHCCLKKKRQREMVESTDTNGAPSGGGHSKQMRFAFSNASSIFSFCFDI